MRDGGFGSTMRNRRAFERRGMQSTFAVSTVHPVVVAPSYNNAGTLADVLTRVAETGLPILLINDGCTDATEEVFDRWQAEHPEAEARIIRHPHNRGKAAALRTGFAAAMRAGFSHAITIDTDGQHDPELIPSLLELAEDSPAAYVLGVRNSRHADYPARSRLGRRLSNLFIRLECGLKVADSQCGMRIYPLELVRTVRCRAARFGYETEMIARAAWAGCPIVEAPINTRYLPAGQRVSHFHPWWDTLGGVAMHARLLLRTITPIPHRRYHPAGLPVKKRFNARDVLRWINPLRAWRELRRGEIDRNEFATALATGVFVANLPLYPCQTVLVLYLARRLHLNPLAALAGSQISTPPITAGLIAGAICAGHLLLHGSMPVWPDFHSAHAVWQTLAWPLLLDWAVGGVVVGMALAAIAFALAHWLYHGSEDPEGPVEPVREKSAAKARVNEGARVTGRI